MISLAHLVGAILKDLSQARMGSDAYSRDISRYYEQDPLLRGFSVPRADLESVELDLKFAFKSAKLTEARDMDTEDRIRSLVDEYKLRASKRAVDLLIAELLGMQEAHAAASGAEKQPGEGATDASPADDATEDTANSKDSKAQKRLDLLLYELQELKEAIAAENSQKAASEVDVSEEVPLKALWHQVVMMLEDSGLKQARDVIGKLLSQIAKNLESDKKHQVNIEQIAQSLYRGLEEKLLRNAGTDAFLKRIGVERKTLSDEYQLIMKPELTAMLGRFSEGLKMLIEEDDDCEVEVLFTAEQLASVPESSISSIKLRTALRNYKWSEVQDEEKDEVVRQLLPE
ncbi:hypothetical protein POL68_17005 [Stigmatella sp. ncwal1]|uniref:Uncharacterized protein n=1 Tax=Stigmatella ashevillensis TaxID=2995309 RepID=A0ABT5D959_9BACT|nr:hypothetical protein [Stigmatella ashevillena]MDC0710179.1 hypothetical protein [Stigmatella ashevillena]